MQLMPSLPCRFYQGPSLMSLLFSYPLLIRVAYPPGVSSRKECAQLSPTINLNHSISTGKSLSLLEQKDKKKEVPRSTPAY